MYLLVFLDCTRVLFFRQSNVLKYLKEMISRMALLKGVTSRLILIPPYGNLICFIYL